MSTVEVIVSEREPDTVQLFATNVDASVAAVAGSIQCAIWLPTALAARLHAALGDKLTTEGPKRAGER